MWITLAKWLGLELIKALINMFSEAYRQWKIDKEAKKQSDILERGKKALENAKTNEERKKAYDDLNSPIN